MPVVSNSSPLIALAEIRQLGLLQQLFGSVWIPSAVVAEIAPSLPRRPDWIEIKELTRPIPPVLLRRTLGSGERETLALALESEPRWVILDDFAARRAAMALALPVIGTLGVLVRAKEAKLIDAIRPYVDELAAGRFFVGEELYRDLLRSVGEALD